MSQENPIRELIAAIGYERLQERLEIGREALDKAAQKGIMPSAWFLVMEAEAHAIGRHCPRDWFNFRRVA